MKQAKFKPEKEFYIKRIKELVTSYSVKEPYITNVLRRIERIIEEYKESWEGAE